MDMVFMSSSDALCRQRKACIDRQTNPVTISINSGSNHGRE